jgi:hypothetical protein
MPATVGSSMRLIRAVDEAQAASKEVMLLSPGDNAGIELLSHGGMMTSAGACMARASEISASVSAGRSMRGWMRESEQRPDSRRRTALVKCVGSPCTAAKDGDDMDDDDDDEEEDEWGSAEKSTARSEENMKMRTGAAGAQ